MLELIEKETLRLPIIVVVDDDVSIRLAIRRLIKSLGYEGIAFSSADEFLRSPYFKEADCLILDIQMPGRSGLDLQSVMAALGAPTPIIFITAFHDEAARNQALGQGALGFLEKPFDSRILISLLQKALTPPKTPFPES